MKTVTVEVEFEIDDEFDPKDSGTLSQIVERSIDNLAEYDDQSLKNIISWSPSESG